MQIAQDPLLSSESTDPQPRHGRFLHAPPRSVPDRIGDARGDVSHPWQQGRYAPRCACGQTAGQSRVEIRPGASAPTSKPSGNPYRKSAIDTSFATLLLLTQNLLCCIDRLNPQLSAAVDDLSHTPH